MTRKTWLITGASSGLGKALAEHVLARGDQAVVTASSTQATTELASRYPETALAVRLDVTDAADREAAVLAAEKRFGSIDILVNNAAIDFVGALEEQEEDDYRRLFEVNFFGAVALTRAVLPGLRRQRSGVIVNVSSMDGLASLPANGFYSASKFALEGFTEALWQEIEPIGLHAMIIQPGSFRTGIENRTRVSGEAIGDYAATAGAFRSMMGSLTPEMFPGDPDRAAEAVYEAATAPEPRHWVVLGSDAQRRIGVKLDELRTEFDAGRDIAFSTDFPGAADNAVL
ncbi:SDR family NAD(P)-dependent oxidoreductase [Streptomyces sp. V4-01]|uniref:SDR family NAD(P)-dependent oxidoreductase n=1 Tax=Actinacidiphila polyblastidii TaxID=3110430 RepID=A0ABU7PBC9_9ACTN|nr:SDR family NAD(P)-dependent oxidoreductase [Streptomyces sp. V4-01]